MSQPRRRGASAERRSFRESAPAVSQLATALASSRAALRRLVQARNRAISSRARRDTRDWQVKRRERTRHLIELGGLVVKAGIVELVDDDRAVIFGIMLSAAAALSGDEREQHLTLWRRRGQRGFAEGA